MAQTVKYIIDADISDFVNAMVGATTASALADKKIRKNFNDMDKAARKLQGSFGRSFKAFDSQLDTSTDLVRDWGVAMRSVNTTSLVLGATAAAGALLGLGIAAGRVTGLLYTIPAALVGVGSILATFAIGFGGISDAVKEYGKAAGGAAGGQKELNKQLAGFDKMNTLEDKSIDVGGGGAAGLADALDKLSPAGKEVAKALYDIGQAFLENVAKPVQEALLTGVAPALRETYAILEGPLRNSLVNVAAAGNLFILEMLRVARLPFFSQFIEQAGQLGAFILNTLRPAIEPLTRGFASIFQVAMPYVEQFTTSLSNAIIQWGNFVSSAEGQSAIKKSIDQGIVALRTLGALLGSIVNVFSATLDAAGDAIYAPVNAVTELINRFATWLRTAEGIRTVNSLLEIATNAVYALGDVLASVGSAFAGVINWFAELDAEQQQFIIRIGIIVAALGGFVSYIGGLISPLTAVGAAVKSMVGSFGGATTAMSGLGGAAGALRLGLGVLMGPIGAIIGVLSLIFTQSEQFRNSLGGLAAAIGGVVVGAFRTLSSVIGPVLSVIGSLASIIGSVLSVAITLLTPVVTFLLEAGLMPLRAILAVLTPILEGIAGVFSTIASVGSNVANVINTVASMFGLGKSAADKLKESTDNQKTAQDKYNDAVQNTIGLSKELQDLQASQVDNQLAVMDSQDRLTEKQNNYNNAVKQYGPDSREAQRASLELQSAQNKLDDAQKKVKDTADQIKTKNGEVAESQKTTARETENLKNKNLDLKTAQDGAKGAADSLQATLRNSIKSGINGLIRIWNDFSIPPVIVAGQQVTPRINFPDIPYLARGGVVDRPTLAMFGEAGEEAVMPLENNTQWIDKLASKINTSNGGGSQRPVVVRMELDGTVIGEAMIDFINEKTQMSGRNSILV